MACARKKEGHGYEIERSGTAPNRNWLTRRKQQISKEFVPGLYHIVGSESYTMKSKTVMDIPQSNYIGLSY